MPVLVLLQQLRDFTRQPRRQAPLTECAHRLLNVMLQPSTKPTHQRLWRATTPPAQTSTWPQLRTGCAQRSPYAPPAASTRALHHVTIPIGRALPAAELACKTASLKPLRRMQQPTTFASGCVQRAASARSNVSRQPQRQTGSVTFAARASLMTTEIPRPRASFAKVAPTKTPSAQLHASTRHSCARPARRRCRVLLTTAAPQESAGNATASRNTKTVVVKVRAK